MQWLSAFSAALLLASAQRGAAIPHSSVWIIPKAGHGPVSGERWPEFIKTAASFLQE